MKMKKKHLFLPFAALLLALACLLGSCVSNPDNKDTPVSSGADTSTVAQTEDLYDENGLLKDSLPATMNFDSDVHVLGWETTRNEFFVEELTDDRVNDSIYNRNLKVSQRLGVKLIYTLIKGNNSNKDAFVTQAEASMSSGTSEYDIIGCYSMCSGILAQRGMLTDLYELEYPDTLKPWWPESLIRSSEINGKLYFITGDISNEFLYNLYFMVVNTGMVKTLGIEDPRALAAENKWTLDKMAEMCRTAYSDLNGSQTPDFGDNFGLVIFNQTHVDSFLAASGIHMTRWDENGSIVLSDDFKGERMVDLVSRLGDWINNNQEICYDATNGYKSIKSGNALLGTCAGSTIIGFRDVDWVYGILPYPMIGENSDGYCTNLGFAYTNYCIPVSARDAEMSGAVIEALASESYRLTSPTLFEVVFKSMYSNDPLDAQMYDIIKSNIYVDMARLYSGNFTWANSAVALFRNSVIANDKSWSSKIAANESYINGVFAEISESFRDK